VGLSANNILGQSSDAQLAYSLLLWRANGVLKSPKHSRETMPEFERDWELLQRAHSKNALVVAGDRTPDKHIAGADAFAGGKDCEECGFFFGWNERVISDRALQPLATLSVTSLRQGCSFSRYRSGPRGEF
jgi:hypothetical protein